MQTRSSLWRRATCRTSCECCAVGASLDEFSSIPSHPARFCVSSALQATLQATKRLLTSSSLTSSGWWTSGSACRSCRAPGESHSQRIRRGITPRMSSTSCATCEWHTSQANENEHFERAKPMQSIAVSKLQSHIGGTDSVRVAAQC